LGQYGCGSNSNFGADFGDPGEADDSEVIWQSLAYAFTATGSTLAQTLYITVHREWMVYGRQAMFGRRAFSAEAAGGRGVQAV